MQVNNHVIIVFSAPRMCRIQDFLVVAQYLELAMWYLDNSLAHEARCF